METVIERLVAVGSPKWFINNYGSQEQIIKEVFYIRTSYDRNPTCPKCGCGIEQYSWVLNRPAMQCKRCGNQVNPLAGTALANIRIHLEDFFQMMFDVVSERYLTSSKFLMDKHKVNYKTAYMANVRIHLLMKNAMADIILHGEVQMDETHVTTGNMGMDCYFKWKTYEKDQTIFGMIEAPQKDSRGRSIEGRMICYHVPDRTKATLRPIIKRHLDPKLVKLLVSDQHKSYHGLARKYNHEIVNHDQWEWKTPGGIDNNVIEGAWKHLKKGLENLGQISEDELQRYVTAQNFFHNYRHLTNDQRFLKLLHSLPPLFDRVRQQKRMKQYYKKQAI